jgi:spermidine-citrate ligase
MTRLHDMDELTGDIATQSVYVRIANPLRGASA